MQIDKVTIALFTFSILAACWNGGEMVEESVNEFVLNSPDDPEISSYELLIPSEYPVKVLESGTIFISAAFPGMIGLSQENESRFYNDNGTWGPDLIRIFLATTPQYKGADLDITNKNDMGRFMLQNILARPDIQRISTESSMEYSEIVEKYIRPRWDDDRFIYVLRHEDQRIALVNCIIENHCKASTTWNGSFSIQYQFLRHHLKDIVRLDESVVALINSFSPTLRYDKEL